VRPKIDYTLYLVIDRNQMRAASIEECVEQAVLGGCTVVQLREKEAPSREFYDIALRVREVTRRLNVPLIINDRADIAIAVSAEGVHVGQRDLPCSATRYIIGRDKVIGVSVSNFNEAVAAVEAGADYLGVGAMFSTGTKTDAELTSMNELLHIRSEINIPIVVIGGINKSTLPRFKDARIDGIAVASAIISHRDAKSAAKELKSMFLRLL